MAGPKVSGKQLSKHVFEWMLKIRNRKTGKETRRLEALSVYDKKRIRRTMRQLIKQDEMVIKNKTGVKASYRTIIAKVS